MPAVRDPLLPLRAAAAAREAAGLRRALRPRGPGADGIIDLASNDYLDLSQDPQVVEGAVAAAQRWGTGATGSRLVTGDTGLHATLEKELAGFAGAQAALVFSSGYLANLAAVTALAAALDPGDGRSRPDGSQPRETRPDGSQAEETRPDGSQPRETRPDGSQHGETRPDGSQHGETRPDGNQHRGTLVVSDEANHASLIDACRLSAARIEIVGHRDVSAVDHALGCRREPAAIVVAE
ncbi:MAG: 8-amino-7-oxononanoate synthase, partial [Streptosporangiaceae bacterium]|nr:8-amino-7-oxononanoate synthase [Streptosporangiaceae bacterium]